MNAEVLEYLQLRYIKMSANKATTRARRPRARANRRLDARARDATLAADDDARGARDAREGATNDER